MAWPLRQAYDYWQDQPGNYYPKRLERRLKAALLAPSRVFSLGWSSSTNPKSPSDSKGKAATVGLPSASGAYERVPLSTIKPPCSSISQSSSALLPVLKETGIVWPSVRTTSNRRRLKGTRQSRRIPEWLFD